MPEAPEPRNCAQDPNDQASGLRKMFERRTAQWSLVLQPTLRAAGGADALARRARRAAAQSGPTLVIDAARSQVGAALGLRLRYDLEHALKGDCALGDACVAVDDALWILPAARALDAAISDERRSQQLSEAFGELALDLHQAVLIVPAGRVSWIPACPALRGVREALIPVARGPDSGASVLTAIRQAVGDAQIDTFHLLFPDMGEAAAGRLLSGLAAIAQRHFGATVLAAPPLAAAPEPLHRARTGIRSVESVF